MYEEFRGDGFFWRKKKYVCGIRDVYNLKWEKFCTVLKIDLLKNLKYQTFRKLRKVISYRKRILIDDLRIESFGKEIRN